jgi:brefeldin A-inhibited guanine nucleotide-exchange protein
VNSDYALRLKLQEVLWMTWITHPPLLHLENESYQSYLRLLQSVAHEKPILAKEIEADSGSGGYEDNDKFGIFFKSAPSCIIY